MPYVLRRRLLEELALSGPAWHTPPSFEDGAALWQVVCELGLEGLVAKRRNERYRSGERGGTKVKNRDYWRYPLELEAARNRRKGYRGAYAAVRDIIGLFLEEGICLDTSTKQRSSRQWLVATSYV
jgi:ATP-dependent DNA ligase